MRTALPWLLLAACGTEGSVEIVVKPPADGSLVEEVELFVSSHDAHTGEFLRSANGPKLGTVYWKRDPDDRDVQLMPVEAPGSITYAFKQGDVDYLSAVVAVGFARRDATNPGPKIPVAVATWLEPIEIPANDIGRYILTLEPYQELDGANPDVTGLDVWGPTPGSRDCVMVDHVRGLDGYDGAPSGAIVTRSDIDCDSYLDEDTVNECVPNGYNGQLPITRDELACATPSKSALAGVAVDSCLVGGDACVDGPPANPADPLDPDDNCKATNYCTSTGLCDLVTGCRDLSCAGIGVAYIECPFYTATAIAAGDAPTVCPNAHAFLDMQFLFPNLGLVCDDVLGTEVRKLGDGFSDKLDYSGLAFRLNPDAAASNAKQCKFTFDVAGQLQSEPGSIDPRSNYLGFIAMPLTLPTAGRGLGLPILFKATSTSNQCITLGTECVLKNGTDPGLRACLNEPPRFDTVVTD